MKSQLTLAILAVATASFATPAHARIKIGDTSTFHVVEGINAWDETQEVIGLNEWENTLTVRITRVGSGGSNTADETWDLAAARVTESLFDNCTAPENKGTIESITLPGGTSAQVCHLQYEDPNNWDMIEAWVSSPDVLPQGFAKKIVGYDEPAKARTYELKAYLKL